MTLTSFNILHSLHEYKKFSIENGNKIVYKCNWFPYKFNNIKKVQHITEERLLWKNTHFMSEVVLKLKIQLHSYSIKLNKLNNKPHFNVWLLNWMWFQYYLHVASTTH